MSSIAEYFPGRFAVPDDAQNNPDAEDDEQLAALALLFENRDDSVEELDNALDNFLFYDMQLDRWNSKVRILS